MEYIWNIYIYIYIFHETKMECCVGSVKIEVK